MTATSNVFSQFMALYNAMVREAANDPRRLITFYSQSVSVRSAADALETFLLRSDFERRVFHGNKKWFPQVPVGFEDAWHDYKQRWADALRATDEILGAFEPAERDSTDMKPYNPDPQFEESFDPMHHDASAAFEIGMGFLEHTWENMQHDLDEDRHRIANMCRISLDAYDYLQNSIGLNLGDVFKRWRTVPLIFMPAHVSNKHGLSEKGSLVDLLNEAARAYVAGAPAAAITMCRAILEMVLKKHYLPSDYQETDANGRPFDKGLGQLIVLAEHRFAFVRSHNLKSLVRRTNKVLHDYSSIERISPEEDKAVVQFIATVKSLVQKAPIVAAR